MPTSNSDAVIELKDANFNFSTICVAKCMMSKYVLYVWYGDFSIIRICESMKRK